jgi:hypothetical protein
MLKKTLPLIFALAVFLAITTARAQIINRSGDLLSEVQTITNNMPRAYSEGFIKPTSGELTKWSNVVKALLDGNFTQADALVRANFPSYQLFRYTDTGYLNRVYYLLRENYPVVKGWGTHIVNPTYARQIAIEVPHAKFETNTELEGVDIFRKTGARFMIINGTARCANRARTPCDGTWTSCGGGRYPESDMGHFVAAAFQTAHQTLAARRPFIYDITGKEVTTLANQPLPAGIHRLPLEASALSSGVYFCRLQVGASSQTIRLNFVK